MAMLNKQMVTWFVHLIQTYSNSKNCFGSVWVETQTPKIPKKCGGFPKMLVPPKSFKIRPF